MSPRVLPPAPALRAALALAAAAALAGCNAAERTALAPGGPRFTQAAVAPVVNSLDDVVDAEGCTDAHCSLREAITFAQPGAQVAFSVTGTITLTTPDDPPATYACLLVRQDLAIRGPGATRLTVAGGPGNVFCIASGVTASISGLTITGGVAPYGANGGGGGHPQLGRHHPPGRHGHGQLGCTGRRHLQLRHADAQAQHRVGQHGPTGGWDRQRRHL